MTQKAMLEKLLAEVAQLRIDVAELKARPVPVGPYVPYMPPPIAPPIFPPAPYTITRDNQTHPRTA